MLGTDLFFNFFCRNATQFKVDCEAKWKVTPQPKMADITYGSKKLDAASNIVFR